MSKQTQGVPKNGQFKKVYNYCIYDDIQNTSKILNILTHGLPFLRHHT